MNHLNSMRLCAAALAVSVSSAAMAQASPAESDDQATAEARSGGIEDIVVTAQRRSENLQDVPIAVAAFNADTIAARRITTTQDLKALVPSLSYNAQAGFAVPYLRGIGTDITQPNSDPSVATYVDGIYIANVAGTITSLLGLERVEVLLGPQGTLYGKNAVGGAINVVTKSPGQTLEGEVTAGYANYQRLEGSAYISGPITDTLSAGIYAMGMRRDSYYNFTVPNDERTFDGTPDHEWNYGVRGKIVFDNGPVRVVGSLEYAKGASADAGVLTNIQPNALGNALGSPFTDKRFEAPNDGATFNNPESVMGHLRMDFDMDFASFISITSYRDLKVNIGADFDGTLAPIVNLIALGSESTTYSQEFQIQSRESSPVKWVAGLYYFFEDGGFLPTGVITGVLFAPVLGPGSFANVSYASVKTNSYAAFAQATIPLTDALSITLGGRYSKDTKQLVSRNSFRSVGGGQFTSPEFGTTVYPVVKDNWSKFTPKVTVDYKIGDTLLYASYSQGYKPGTYNIASPATPGPVKPETLTAYEAGIKSDLLDGRLRINAAGYYYDFKDIQVQVNAQGQGSLAVLRNGAAAEAYGIEFAIQAKPTDRLSLFANASFEKSKYKSFQNFPGYSVNPGGPGNVPTTFDASGNDLVRAPEFVSNLGASYEFPINDDISLTASGDWYHNDGFFWEASNQARQSAYDLFNASLTLSSDRDGWSAMGWIKNIGNERYFNALLITDFGTVINDADPRTYGITLSKKF